ncbi:MAG: hypothetical protein NT075_31475 [Chloroflexi bacterium]|nr:hypothetical protein [Chloroflexota bacterium]
MSKADLNQEIQFGLENLGKIHTRVAFIFTLDVDKTVQMSALTYECFGYYNAVEHLMLRFIKYLKIEQPTGAFSHSETLKRFGKLMHEQALDDNGVILKVFLELMAFRHVATKIYGFLIDEAKLTVIVTRIKTEHSNIVSIFDQLLSSIH